MKQFFSYFMRSNHKTLTPLCYGAQWDDFEYRMRSELERIKGEQKTTGFVPDNQYWEKAK